MSDVEAPQALRHLWASPALFVLAAFVAFNVAGSRGAGWALMAGGCRDRSSRSGGRRYAGNGRRRRSSSYRWGCWC
ncbi:hypothetical protein O1157_18840 [Streptomyces albogriseolus]